MKIFHMIHLNPVSKPVVGLHVRQLMTAATWILLALALSHSFPALATETEADALRRSGWCPDYITSNTSLSHCAWPGISCDDSGRVVEINLPQSYSPIYLSSMNFSLLPNLCSLQVSDNYLTGIIPLQICALPKLRHLNLSDNHLTGELPLCLQNLTTLEVIDIHNNQIDSPIPPELGNLKSLIHLDFSFNSLHGLIPPTLAKLRNLTHLYLQGNAFNGSIPPEIGNLTNLAYLSMEKNTFSGCIPPELGNLKSLIHLDFSFNSFHGPIPPTLAKLRNLTHLYLQGNAFNGTIPPEIGNLTNLAYLSMKGNIIGGYIPLELGNLKSLIHLDFNFNSLHGLILPTLAKLRNLTYLYLQGNAFNGSIPPEIRNLTNLVYLSMEENTFSGCIPSEIGFLTGLAHLDLSFNNFSGKIPQELGSLVMLTYLNLQNNSLHGSVPNFKKLSRLDHIDLSYNHLTGNVPQNLFNVPYTSFKGNEGLEYTAMETEANALRRSGWWPDPLTSNVSLAHCMWPGISCDDSGSVVKINITQQGQHDYGAASLLCAFPKLRHLNLSHNRLTSEFPLCLQNLTIKKSVQSETVEKNGDFLSIWNYDGRIAYEDIINATEDFDIKYCIGTGGYGSVYRARLPNGKIVALKKLHRLEAEDPSFDKSFRNEVKHLTEVRHRSIIKLYGFCLHERCMFLVYEYMERGSLFCVLRDDYEAVELDWSKRLKIVWDIAHALSYLHHDCAQPIIHRDISSNNILLDNKMQAFLSDFGTARLMEPNFSSNLTANIAGTHGYIAPGEQQ
ncbi:hypothetical protein NL676_014896 [Syzygium grande]|nr:hypothetical protein NL676_014896 [Syzygium grande]